MKEDHQFLVVEDDVLIAEDIKDILRENEINRVVLAHSFEEAIQMIEIHSPAFALLDIRMKNELDGFELAKLLNEKYKIPFMFVTSHSDETLVKRIIKAKPLAYITKPINKVNFFAQIQLALNHLNDNHDNNSIVTIKDGNVVHNIQTNTISYVAADGNYLNVFTNVKKYYIRMSTAELLEKLPDNFIKTHRSFIVNRDQIDSYTSTSLTVVGEEIPVSRGMKDEFLAKMR